MQEIKLNKDLSKLQDNIVMGLTARQAGFGIAGLIVGGVSYFYLINKNVNSDLAFLVLAFLVSPFAALGFFHYHGMTFEKFIKVLIQQYILCPKVLKSKLENSLYDKDKQKIIAMQKLEAKLNNDEDIEKRSL